MAKLNKRDYYYGAALSFFLSKNKDSRPSLLECSDNSCQYRMSTDTSEDFIMYMKYTGKVSVTEDERIWDFPLTDVDKERIAECVEEGLKIYIVLICGGNKNVDGEVAVLTYDEYCSIAHKKSVRIKLKGKKPQKFIIAAKQSDKSFAVDRNRFDGRLTDV